MSRKIICIIAALALCPILVGCDSEDREIKIIHEIHNESNESNEKNNIVDNRVDNQQTIYVERNSYDYIIPDSSTRYLTRAELSVYTPDELSYIRNEIFARHGYVFNMDKYANYFGCKSWYYPDYSYNGNYSVLNKVEVANIELLKDREGIN